MTASKEILKSTRENMPKSKFKFIHAIHEINFTPQDLDFMQRGLTIIVTHVDDQVNSKKIRKDSCMIFFRINSEKGMEEFKTRTEMPKSRVKK